VGCKNSVRLQIRCFRGFRSRCSYRTGRRSANRLCNRRLYKAGPDTRAAPGQSASEVRRSRVLAPHKVKPRRYYDGRGDSPRTSLRPRRMRLSRKSESPASVGRADPSMNGTRSSHLRVVVTPLRSSGRCRSAGRRSRASFRATMLRTQDTSVLLPLQAVGPAYVRRANRSAAARFRQPCMSMMRPLRMVSTW
jgi:hypothetical protein